MNYYLIDGLNLAHRSHNAQFELKTSDGRFSGMIYQFLSSIYYLKRKNRTFKVGVVWDRKPLHKYELFDGYKEGRTRLPDNVYSQIPDIERFLEHCGVDQFHAEHQEADDVIASLAERYVREDEGAKVVILTNDKDMLQLVRDGKIVVHKPKVGLSPERFFDEEAVKELFGVAPGDLACFRSMSSDESDKLVGVRRVRRKVLAGMVEKHKTLDNIYASLEGEKLTEKEMQRMLEGRERVFLNYKLMALNRDLDNIEHRKSHIDRDVLSEILDVYEIKSLKVDNMIEVFTADPNIKFTEPKKAVELESYSLF